MPRLPSSILDRNRFKRQADRCHSLSTSHKPVLSPLCFHGLTNCFSRKPFAFINICVAPRVSPPTVHAIQEFTSRSNQLYYRHTVMNSLSSRKKPSALESATSTLFHKNTRGGVGLWLVSSKSAGGQRNRQAHTKDVNNDADHHHLQRERKLRSGGKRDDDAAHEEIHGYAVQHARQDSLAH